MTYNTILRMNQNEVSGGPDDTWRGGEGVGYEFFQLFFSKRRMNIFFNEYVLSPAVSFAKHF